MECVICGADTYHCGGCEAKTPAAQEALRIKKIGRFDPIPHEEGRLTVADLTEPKDARLDQFKIFIQGELSPDEIKWMAELAADFLSSDKVMAWRTAGLATGYRAALAEAQPIGNTDKLTALVEKLISDLGAARKEIADFEASWACP